MSKNRRKRHPHPGRTYEHQDTEPLLVGCLVRLGCGTTQSPELDHKFKIDVLIDNIRSYPRGKPPIGIQMTQSLNHFAKMRAFVREAVKYPGIGPLLYCEIDGRVTMEMGRALRECCKDLWNEWRPDAEMRPRRLIVTSGGQHYWKKIPT